MLFFLLLFPEEAPLTVLMQVVRRKYKQIPIEEMIASRVFRRYPQHPHFTRRWPAHQLTRFPPEGRLDNWGAPLGQRCCKTKNRAEISAVSASQVEIPKPVHYAVGTNVQPSITHNTSQQHFLRTFRSVKLNPHIDIFATLKLRLGISMDTQFIF